MADVRSAPYSRRYPHFNRDSLKQELKSDRIAYVFLGNELGGRPVGHQFFCEGVANYEAMAQTSSYRHGIQRVLKGRQAYKIALMCSEHSPLDCHRCLLVGRSLSEHGLTIGHILSNGSVKTQSDIESELLSMANLTKSDIFTTDLDRLVSAYRDRARKVAYSDSGRNYPTAAE